jgi:Bacterial Ig domain
MPATLCHAPSSMTHATIPPMTTRHGRPSQVRPRPPSTGRPAPAKSRTRAPAPGRLAAHRRVETTRRLALPFRLLFVAAIVGLGAGVLFVASGGIGRVAEGLGATLAGFVDDLTATPVPSVLPPSLAGAPVIEKPDEPYTNQPTVDLVGTIPEEATGQLGNRIRLYVAIGEQDPGVVTEIPVGQTIRFVIPEVTLVEGSNAFSATIVSDAGESEPSPVVTYVFDPTIPRIVVSSPRNGAVVNAKSVSIEGETQPRSEVRIWNATSNLTVNGAADENGKFAISLPIVAGQNDIGVTVIDPAGNANHAVIAVLKGSGKLVAALSASAYTIKLSRLPERVTLTVSVTDPDGRPLEGARVTFSLAVPGVPAVTSKTIKSAGDGSASWSTTIPRGATKGQVSATVIVKTSRYGETTDRTVINLAK